MLRPSLILFLFAAFFCDAQEGLFTVTGSGTVDMEKVKHPFQAKKMAARAAKADAQRQLYEAVKGVRLTSGTTIEEYEVQSDIIATRVKGMLQGAFIVNEDLREELGTFVAEVKLAICEDNTPPQCKNKLTLKELLEMDESIAEQ